jgi:hypothetical protein
MLELAAKTAAITAVALPVIGFLTRAIAFGLCTRLSDADAWRLAATTSLGDLTVAGIWPVAIGAPFYIGAFISAGRPKNPPTLWVIRKDENGKPLKNEKGYTIMDVVPLPEDRKRSLREKIGLTLFSVPVFGFLGLAVFFLPLLSYGLLLGAMNVSTRWMRRIYGKRRDLRLAWTWPVLIVSLAYGCVTSGVQYRLPVAQYSFSSSSGAPGGRYVEVAHDGGLVYLLSCTDPSAEPVAVPESSIDLVTYAHPIPEGVLSLYTVVTHTAPRLGLQTVCP